MMAVIFALTSIAGDSVRELDPDFRLQHSAANYGCKTSGCCWFWA